MSQKSNKRALVVHIKNETHDSLDAMSLRLGITKSDLVRAFMRLGIKEINQLDQSLSEGEIDDLEHQQHMYEIYRKDV